MGRTDLSVIIPLRDQEKRVASIVRAAGELTQYIAADAERADDGPLGVEVLALDERSGDNTLAVLSLLHGQLPNLRTLQDLDPGTAIRRSASVARGRVWLVLDSVVDPRLSAWAVGQVFRGQRAAIVPGEILAVDRALGVSVLANKRGGLVSAQRHVQRYLRVQKTPPAWTAPSKRGAGDRARLFMRGRFGGLGMAWLDRPSNR